MSVKTRKESLVKGAKFYGTTEAFKINAGKTPDCSWCGLRLGPHVANHRC